MPPPDKKILPPNRGGSIIINNEQVNFPYCSFAKGISSNANRAWGNNDRGLEQTTNTLFIRFYSKKPSYYQYASYIDIDTGNEIRPKIDLNVANSEEIIISPGAQVFPSGGALDRLTNRHSDNEDSNKKWLTSDDLKIVIEGAKGEAGGRVIEGYIDIKRDIQAPVMILEDQSSNSEKKYDLYEKQKVYFECGQDPENAY